MNPNEVAAVLAAIAAYLGAAVDVTTLVRDIGLKEKVSHLLSRDPELVEFRKVLRNTYDNFSSASKVWNVKSALSDGLIRDSAEQFLRTYGMESGGLDPIQALSNTWKGSLPADVATTWSSDIDEAAALYLQCLRKALSQSEVFRPMLIADEIGILTDNSRTGLQLQAKQLVATEEVAHILREFGKSRGPTRPPFQAPEDEFRLLVPRPFIGRSVEKQWLLTRLQSDQTQRIAALYGVGGLGKTAIAAKVIRELAANGSFPDGRAVFLCEGKRDAIDVLRNILRKFDSSQAILDFLDPDDIPDGVHRVVKDKNALIVLDGVERELDEQALLSPLRDTAVSLLLTSRHPLSADVVPNDVTLQVKPLPHLQARKIFLSVLGKTKPQRAHQANLVAIDQIVEAMERHTLALKVAGNHARLNGDFAALAYTLADPGYVLELALDGTPRAVAILFERSIHACHQDAQYLFASLASFAASEFPRDAVLAAGEALRLASPVSALDELVERALVDSLVNDNASSAQKRLRLRLHPLLRAIAQSLLDTLSEEQQVSVCDAIASYFCTTIDRFDYHEIGIDERNLIGLLEGIHTDQVSEDAIASLCALTFNYFRDTGRTALNLRYLPWATSSLRESGQAIDLANTLHAYADTLIQVGQQSEAEDALGECLDIFRARHDQEGEARALHMWGRLYLRRSDFELAEKYFRDAESIFRARNLRLDLSGASSKFTQRWVPARCLGVGMGDAVGGDPRQRDACGRSSRPSLP